MTPTVVESDPPRLDGGDGCVAIRRWSPAAGDGGRAPIVLFHESLGCIGLWRDFPAALAAGSGRTVVAYDRLGFGRSDRRNDGLSADFIADEARRVFPALCRHLGIDRFVAFGHSVGGAMAVHCAAAAGARCEALVTEAAQCFVDEAILAGIRAARRHFAQPEALHRLRRHHGDKTRWVLDAWIETWLAPGFAGWSLRDVLPGVICPALVVHGSRDEYGGDAHPATIARLTGGPARLEIIPDTGHVPHRQRQAAVVDMVAGFLAAPPVLSPGRP